MLKYLISDVANLLEYGPMCLFAGSVLAGVRACFELFQHRKINFKRTLLYFLFGFYLCMVFEVALLNRSDGKHAHQVYWQLNLSSRWPNMRAFVFENIIMLLPLGIFLPEINKCFKRVWIVALIGGATSLIIETIQFFTGRGYCQLEDFIMNTGGAIIGFAMYSIITHINKLLER